MGGSVKREESFPGRGLYFSVPSTAVLRNFFLSTTVLQATCSLGILSPSVTDFTFCNTSSCELHGVFHALAETGTGRIYGSWRHGLGASTSASPDAPLLRLCSSESCHIFWVESQLCDWQSGGDPAVFEQLVCPGPVPDNRECFQPPPPVCLSDRRLSVYLGRAGCCRWSDASPDILQQERCQVETQKQTWCCICNPSEKRRQTGADAPSDRRSDCYRLFPWLENTRKTSGFFGRTSITPSLINIHIHWQLFRSVWRSWKARLLWFQQHFRSLAS